MKERILSGIQPSGVLHIGNYLGALKQWVELQSAYESYFCIVDLHAITVPYDPKTMQQRIMDAALDYLAAGLDPKKSVVFIQSHVPEHTELMWLLNTIVPIAELQRMTQFKDKSQKQEKNISAGLLNYPVLMAADILAYKAGVVPVGEDQVQHVELARIIARKFNNAFGTVFPEPKTKLTTAKRVMSLSDPTRKMSKSDGEASYVAITDAPDAIQKKLRKAVTATAGGNANPGAQNLLMLLKEFGNEKTYQQFAKAEADGSIKYVELKDALAQAIGDHFADFRAKRAELAKHPDKVKKILTDGAQKARTVASQTLKETKEKMGLL